MPSKDDTGRAALLEVVQVLRSHGALVVSPVSYETVVSYLDGFAAGTRSRLLSNDFRVWRTVHHPHGRNLAWPWALPNRAAWTHTGRDRSQAPATGEALAEELGGKDTVDLMLELLEAFLTENPPPGQEDGHVSGCPECKESRGRAQRK